MSKDGHEAIGGRDRRPLPAQVHERIRERIRRGDFVPGDRLPTEGELCTQFGVSRVTIREALRMLQRDRLVESRQGSGHFVLGTPAMIEKPVTELQSVTELMHGLGFEVRTEVLSVSREPAAEHATALRLTQADEVYRLERLWRSPDEPVIYSIDVFPVAIVREEPRDWTGSLLAVFEGAGLTIAYSHALITATALPRQIARRAAVPPSMPWILMSQVNFSADDVPMLKSFDYHRGDKFEFYTLRQRRTQ
jgi:DNA-binding GntR family transcriptional regulator